MAHTALYGGTVYEKKGGADLVGGTVYKKDHGKVLVGGTAYEVGFAKPVTITVTGTGLDYYVYIQHAEGGYAIYSSPATFIANVGDTIYCYCTECYGSQFIYLNGDVVTGGYGENDISYAYTVVSDAKIELYEYSNNGEKRNRYGYIKITEIPEGHVLVTITGSNAYTVVTIDGIEQAPSTIAVPIGTTVICTVTSISSSGRPYITLNGATVSNDTYTYTVVGNVTIERTDEYVSGGGGKDPFGVIHIIEE